MVLSKHLTRLLPITLCLFCLLLAACETGENTTSTPKLVKAPANKQIYTIPTVAITDFSTLDPALAQDTTSIKAIQMLFTGLVQEDNKLQIHPQLAQSWNLSADGLTWTFHLKPHLTFSDGTPLTSADVAYSIDRALQPATQSRVAPLYLSLIKDADRLLAGKITTLINDSLQTPDATTLIIVTRKKAAYFLAMLTSPCAYVVEKSLISQYGAAFTDHLNTGGGTGPFKIAQYVHGQSIDFVPNPHYYNALPQLQHVKFVMYHSEEDAYHAYQNHKVDITALPLSSFATDKKRSDFHQVAQAWINYYAMNYLAKPFDNIHIRQAFALAIDKQAIAQKVWKNTVIPTNHIIPQGMTGYNPQLTGPDGTQNLSGNPSKAQALLRQGLQEEGWTNISQMPSITLTYAKGIPAFDQEVQMLLQQWQKVLHITVNSNALEYDTLLDKVTAATLNPQGLQCWGLAWIGEYPDPQNWLSHQFGAGVPNNNSNYGQTAQQQALQQTLDTADANTQQPNERLQSYRQAEQQLVNDVAWLPIEQVTTNFLRSPYIVGIVDNADDIIPPDDWSHIYRVQ
jgi:oligopeptide transport system substrate-binding protein